MTSMPTRVHIKLTINYIKLTISYIAIFIKRDKYIIETNKISTDHMK